MEGLVLRIDAKVCHVDVAGTTHMLPLRGRLFEKRTTKEARPIAVGDRVEVTLEEGGGAIDAVLPRTSRLARRKAGDDDTREQVIAANVSLVMVMASIRDPKFQPELVDRILAGAEREHIRPVLAITKVDRDKQGVAEDWAEMYREIGYESFVTCVLEGKETHDSLASIRDLLHQNVTVITGASGVGKSSLINTLIPGLNLRIGSIGRIRQGKHTTSHTQLISLPSGGHVLDTPGIRSFGLQNLEPLDLTHCFPDILEFARQCAFRNCTHTVEPDCAVLPAAEESMIAQSRYVSYTLMLRDLIGEPKEE
jgi:ribosome biogenesis GTPase / thiamine phosphate phosphatase